MSVGFNLGIEILAYFCYSSNVLYSVLRREAQIFVQTKSHIVSVQSVGLKTKVEKVLLEGGCDRGFTRS
jgi:hypothetical protein